MSEANPTYLLEHIGAQIRVTVTHAFTQEERVTFTVLLPAVQNTLTNLHDLAFGRLREYLSKLP